MFKRLLALPTDQAHKVTVQETNKADKSSTFLLDPNLLKRSETFYQHKHANAALESAADWTKLIQCQFPVDRFHLFDMAFKNPKDRNLPTVHTEDNGRSRGGAVYLAFKLELPLVC